MPRIEIVGSSGLVLGSMDCRDGLAAKITQSDKIEFEVQKTVRGDGVFVTLVVPDEPSIGSGSVKSESESIPSGSGSGNGISSDPSPPVSAGQLDSSAVPTSGSAGGSPQV